jgi:Asp/Glu/hydantoin racemase
MKTLALIHTSFIFIKVDPFLDALFAEILPEVRLVNILDDSLLADVMKANRVTPAVTRRLCAYVQAAEAAGADAALSLCSSLGPAVDTARKLVDIPVLKIDEAMAEEAAASAQRIGVLATVESTLNPTLDLVRRKADRAGKNVEIHPGLVQDALKILLSGDRNRHDQMVAEQARRLAPQVDVLLLAQGSMTRLAPRLADETGLPVLTSPRLGIEQARRILFPET